MSVYATYSYEMDFGLDGTYGHAKSDVTSYVISAAWQAGVQRTWDDFAPPARLRLTVANVDNEWSQENAASRFYGLLRYGLLVRVRATYGTTRTLFIGRLTNVTLTAQAHQAQRQAVLTCEDLMLDLLDAEYVPEVETDVRTDQEIANVLESGIVAYPYASNYWVLGHSTLETDTVLLDNSGLYDLETGIETLAYTGDNAGTDFGVSTQGYLRQIVSAEMGGLFYWNQRSGQFRFLDRQYFLRNGTVQATLTEADLHMNTPPPTWGADLYNAITTNYQVREVGAANTVLWEAPNVPITMTGGKRRSFRARYQSLEQETPARVSATNVITPVKGTDVIVNTASDGSGQDARGYVNVTYKGDATGASIELHNATGTTCYITHLQVRGTPLYIWPREQYTHADPTSIATHGRSANTLDVSMVSDTDKIESYTKIRVARHKDALTRFGRLTFLANQDATLMGHMLDRSVGERVRVNLSGDSWSTHDAQYIIVGEVHQVDAATRQHLCTWIVQPAESLAGWVLEDATLSILEETTHVVF